MAAMLAALRAIARPARAACSGTGSSVASCCVLKTAATPATRNGRRAAWVARATVRALSSTPKLAAPAYDSEPAFRAVVTALHADPLDAIASIQVHEMEPPDPATLKPTDVVVRVRATGANWVDVLQMSGQYQHQPQVPYCPGMEYSGDVVWAGSEVDNEDAAVGERVFVDIFNAGPRSKGDYQKWGGFATYAVAPALALKRAPPSFSYDQAAVWCGAYETSHHALVKRSKLQPGETVLIHGATGSSGLAAVQIATALGADVIATGGDDDKLALVEEHGQGLGGSGKVVATYNYRTSDTTMREAVRGVVPQGVDVVFDSVGGQVSIDSLRCVKFGARFCIVGWTSTPFAAGGAGAGSGKDQQPANVLPTNLIMMKGLDVLGSPVVIHTVADPAIRPPRVADLDRMADAGLLKPFVSHTFPLDGAKDALMAKWNRQVTGSATVNP